MVVVLFFASIDSSTFILVFGSFSFLSSPLIGKWFDFSFVKDFAFGFLLFFPSLSFFFSWIFTE